MGLSHSKPELPKINYSLSTVGLFSIFGGWLSSLGVVVGIGVVSLLVFNYKKIIEFLQELWSDFSAYEINERAWWVKFIKTAKIPGLKDAVKPGLHVCKR
jgi:hypothetical protein